MGLDYIDLFLAHFPCAIKPGGDLARATNFTGATGQEQKAALDEAGRYVPDLQHCPKAVARLNGGDGSFIPTWQAMKNLVRKGKCRAIGLSNFEREHIEEILPHASHDDIPISCNQIEAHPWYPNTELIDFLHLHHILPTIYSPFAPKVFQVVDEKVVGHSFKPDGVTLLEEPIVKGLAAGNLISTGQVLQSWAVQRGTVPLAKSQSKERITKNLEVRRLSDEAMEKLRALQKDGKKGKCVDLNLLFPGLIFTGGKTTVNKYEIEDSLDCSRACGEICPSTEAAACPVRMKACLL